MSNQFQIFITIFRCIIFSWFSFLLLYKAIHYNWCEFHKNWLLFACSISVVGSCFVVDWIFSLGYDICGNPENDPPEQDLEQQQQPGKLFDHINPSFLSSLLLFTTSIHAWLFVFKLSLATPVDACIEVVNKSKLCRKWVWYGQTACLAAAAAQDPAQVGRSQDYRKCRNLTRKYNQTQARTHNSKKPANSNQILWNSHQLQWIVL